MTHPQLVAWIVTLIVGLRAPGMHSYVPEAQETRTAALERYQQIAESIATVSRQDPLFPGDQGPARTAALLVSVAYHESGFRRDIDLGLGRERNGRTGENDYGRSWCMVQMHLGKRLIRTPEGQFVEDSGQTTAEGWTGRDLIADRIKCFTAGRNAIRRSLSACRSLPRSKRLAAYASGSCESELGQLLSTTRMRTAQRVWDKHPPSALLDPTASIPPASSARVD
jgi:hypothetical protein